MKNLKTILCAIVLSCLAAACSDKEEPCLSSGPQTVSVCVVDGDDSQIDVLDTKAYVGSDRSTVSWDNDDKLYVWAYDGSSAVLSEQEFFLYASAVGKAYFSTELPEAMNEGTYTYYACSPKPVSTSGLNADFSIPSTQDGRGEGIAIAVAGTAGPLCSTKKGTPVQLSLQQVLHLLAFNYEDAAGILGGEPIKRLYLTFPGPVCGELSKSLKSPTSRGTLTGGVKAIDLRLASPLESGEGNAFASIFPQPWAATDYVQIKFYTDTKFGYANPVCLKSRNMLAGHCTPVQMTIESASEYFALDFVLESNPLGEDIQSIKIEAPSVLGDVGSTTYVYGGTKVEVGETFSIGFEEDSEFYALAGKTLTVTYESEHITSKQSIKLGDLTQVHRYTVSMNVTPLLYEDFSSVGSFSSDDEYTSGFNSGSKDPHTFLSGWSGARAGAQAGKCVRIACRRETSADYAARMDSAPLSATIKKACNLCVEFNYGINNEYGGISILVYDGNVGQDVHLGYIRTTDNYESGDEDGTFEDDNSFYAKEYTGSYDSTPNDASYTIHNVAAGSVTRITWRTTPEHQAGTTNTTCWLYIDNVKVTVAQ